MRPCLMFVFLYLKTSENQYRIPIMAPVISVVRTPARIERGPRAMISPARSGTMV